MNREQIRYMLISVLTGLLGAGATEEDLGRELEVFDKAVLREIRKGTIEGYVRVAEEIERRRTCD